jgi:hypothetical protein
VLGGAGCSSGFPVLVKVKPDVDAPKAVDIVWVLTENDAIVNDELLIYKKKGMAEYFRTGRSTLSPGYFRFHRFALQGEVGGSSPLEVRSDPGLGRAKLYGPYREPIPSGAAKGFLFIEYGKGSESLGLPMMIYPRLPTYLGYEDKAPGGISIEIGRDACKVDPYEKESPEVIREAEGQERSRLEGHGGGGN